MTKFLCALLVLAIAIVPVSAFAGTGGTDCASARTIFFQGTSYSGDTSAPGYGNPVGGFGPLPSPSNDAIYTFVANNTFGTITVTAAGYNYGIFLTTNCAGTTAPPIQAATGPAVGGSFPVSGLTNGQQYFVIMSGNPSDSSAPNGSYTFITSFPVDLQSFTIE